MRLIETKSKEKLPKGFSYPLGAEAISTALSGIPQFNNAHLYFLWRDDFFVSRWRKRVEAFGQVKLLNATYLEYFSRWHIHLYSVPSKYAVFARERLCNELPSIKNKLSKLTFIPKSFVGTITLSLREAETAVNDPMQPFNRLPTKKEPVVRGNLSRLVAKGTDTASDEVGFF